MHRVGVIPFDIQDDAIAVLFVTSQTRGRWILPKGRMKSKETHVEACAREGFEEAGVKGVVLKDFPFTVLIGKQLDGGVQKVPVTYYPFLVMEQLDEWPEKKRRQRHWALINEASKVAYREDYLGLVRQFKDLRPWITEVAKLHKSKQPVQPMPAQ